MIKIIRKCNLSYRDCGDIIDKISVDNVGIVHKKDTGTIDIIYQEKYYHIEIKYQSQYTKYTISRKISKGEKQWKKNIY